MITSLREAEQIALSVYRLAENRRSKCSSPVIQLRNELKARGEDLPELNKVVCNPEAAAMIMSIFGGYRIFT